MLVMTASSRAPSRTAPKERPAEVRGWLVATIADYLPRDRLAMLFREASPGLVRALATSSEDHQSWARFDEFVEALVITDRLVGRGDLSACTDIGRFTAAREMGPVRSFALGLLKPATIMTMATSLWSVHYRNAGRASARITGSDSVTVSLIDVPKPHRAHCLAVGGWILGVLELGPRSGVRVEKLSCRCDGAASCDFRVGWSPGGGGA